MNNKAYSDINELVNQITYPRGNEERVKNLKTLRKYLKGYFKITLPWYLMPLKVFRYDPFWYRYDKYLSHLEALPGSRIQREVTYNAYHFVKHPRELKLVLKQLKTGIKTLK